MCLCAFEHVEHKRGAQGTTSRVFFSLSAKGSWDWTQLLRLASRCLYWTVWIAPQSALLFPLVEPGFPLHIHSYFKLIPSEEISCQLAHTHLHGLWQHVYSHQSTSQTWGPSRLCGRTRKEGRVLWFEHELSPKRFMPTAFRGGAAFIWGSNWILGVMFSSEKMIGSWVLPSSEEVIGPWGHCLHQQIQVESIIWYRYWEQKADSKRNCSSCGK